MLLTQMRCDGCGRRPSLGEWFRGELTAEGYPEWRHPGITFKQCGVPISIENRAKVEYLFQALYGRPMPVELGFLCPQCQEYAEEEIPALSAAYRGEPAGGPSTERTWMGQ